MELELASALMDMKEIRSINKLDVIVSARVTTIVRQNLHALASSVLTHVKVPVVFMPFAMWKIMFQPALVQMVILETHSILAEKLQLQHQNIMKILVRHLRAVQIHNVATLMITRYVPAFNLM